MPTQTSKVGTWPSLVEAAIAIAVSTTIASNTSTSPIISCGLKSVPGACSRQLRLMHDTSPQAAVAMTAPVSEKVDGNGQR